MRRFEPLSDTDLVAKISRYETALEDAELGGGVGKIQGEGRMMEITRANSANARQTLQELLFERSCRPSLNNGEPPAGYAIPVRFAR